VAASKTTSLLENTLQPTHAEFVVVTDEDGIGV
jgi:hypothetical protein